jgi:glycosyltransferase involved in cell wall biosynthesis
MKIALIGPAYPYKGGGAQHTTELAHRLTAAGHDVVIESWQAMYPAVLYPGVQTAPGAEGEPYPRTRRLLSWRRPDGWLRAGKRLRGVDLTVFAFLAPVQVPAYLAIVRGLRRARGGGPAVVVICHNVLPHERRPGDVRLTRALLRRADEILTHTERLARAARDLAPGTPVRVAPMPPHLPARGGTAAPEDGPELSGAPLGVRGGGDDALRPSGAAPGLGGDPPEPPGAPLAVPAWAGTPEPAAAQAARPAPASGAAVPAGGGPESSGAPPVGGRAAGAAEPGLGGAVPGGDGPEYPRALRRPRSARHAAAVRDQGAESAAGQCLPPARTSLHLLFFGIVRPYKGLDVLLRALARAGGGPPMLTLTVAGEFWGGLHATRALVSELGLGDRVELRPGYVAAGEIGALLGAADALVLPYRHATASQNAWLAFSHRVPVIATRTGTFGEQVSDGVNGLLCEPGDESSLAAALARFGEPGVAKRLRDGVRPVAEDALWEAYLAALLAAAVPGTPPTPAGVTT